MPQQKPSPQSTHSTKGQKKYEPLWPDDDTLLQKFAGRQNTVDEWDKFLMQERHTSLPFEVRDKARSSARRVNRHSEYPKGCELVGGWGRKSSWKDKEGNHIPNNKVPCQYIRYNKNKRWCDESRGNQLCKYGDTFSDRNKKEKEQRVQRAGRLKQLKDQENHAQQRSTDGDVSMQQSPTPHAQQRSTDGDVSMQQSRTPHAQQQNTNDDVSMQQPPSSHEQRQAQQSTAKVNELLSSKKEDPSGFQDEIKTLYNQIVVEIDNNAKNPQNRCKRKTSQTVVPLPYLPHQKLIQQYFTPKIKLNGLLIWHSVGTGKTCLATSVLSNFAYDKWRILWVTRNSIKTEPLKNMIHNVCDRNARAAAEKGKIRTSDNLFPSFVKYERWDGRGDKKGSDHSKFIMSYKEFANLCTPGKSTTRRNQLRMPLNNKQPIFEKTLIVVDEAHNLFELDVKNGGLSPSERTNIVTTLRQSYKTTTNGRSSSSPSPVPGAKLLLLTATPFKENYVNAIRLINLLKKTSPLPEDAKQLQQKYGIVTDRSKKAAGPTSSRTPSSCQIPTAEQRKLFAKDTLGLISYFSDNTNADYFPIKVRGDTIESPVSEKQMAGLRALYGRKNNHKK